MAKETLSRFVELTIAKLTGDDSKVIALRNQKMAKSSFTEQIAKAKADTFSYENAVEEAKERVADALINNGEEIKSDSSGRAWYVSEYLKAKEKHDTAKRELEEHKEFLKMLEEALKEVIK